MEIDQLHEGVSQGLSKDRNLEGTRPLELTRESAERQRVATAMRMGSLAAATHHAAGDLEEQFPQAARYMRDAASGFERISNLLRDPNLDEVATLIGNLGRRQPAAIVAGVVLMAHIETNKTIEQLQRDAAVAARQVRTDHGFPERAV